VNLAGIDSSEIQRGMTLAPPGLFTLPRASTRPSKLLPGARPSSTAPPFTSMLERRGRSGSAAAGISRTDETGSRAHVRFLLHEPLLILPGDRFIVRMFSPVVTIGGGVVLDAAPPQRIRRATSNQRLDQIEKDGLAAVAIGESAYGLSGAELIARCGVRFPEPWYENSVKLRSFKTTVAIF